MSPHAEASPHAADGHDPGLAHHFSSPVQQFEAARLGMWIFLATEVLFFGGLFCAYAVYRAAHPEVFVYGHQFLSKTLGAVNTVILICSSFTMAWAVRAAQLRQRAVLQLMLVLTLMCAFGFLGIKYVEYSHKWQHGLLWAGSYSPDQHQPAEGGGHAAAAGEAGHQVEPVAPRNARVFFSIYFLMTGLHGMHVVGGIGAMLWLLLRASRGHFSSGYFTPVDMVGLYWHLVDLIWIYLFLLLYLIH
jgi:cytochrome c oxidase subunit 3